MLHSPLTDRIISITIRVVQHIPHSIRVALLRFVYWSVVSISSRYRKIAYRNMQQVFPDATHAERRALLYRSAGPFARMVSDLFRVATLDSKWFSEHVSVERLSELREIVAQKPVLYLGGHIGSFDLMVAALGLLVQPIDFIVRENKSRAVEEWSERVRTRYNNGVIPRSGGLRKILKQMTKGRAVGFLFDQNVTRNHAAFVDWFGRIAATTIAPGLIAEKMKCPVIILSIRYDKSDSYTIRWVQLNQEVLYQEVSSEDETRKRVLLEAVKELEKVIREQPEDWFWLHRRWKTTPEGMPEDFYLG